MYRFVISVMSFDVCRKVGTLYWSVSWSSAAATALETGPKSAEIFLSRIIERTLEAPVAGVALSSELITLTSLPSRPPLAFSSSAASWTPWRPPWPSDAIEPLSVVEMPTLTKPAYWRWRWLCEATPALAIVNASAMALASASSRILRGR